MNAQMNEPYLEITVQPIDLFRFRYETEMGTSHGFLTGRDEGTFPTVCLHNFSGRATIRCSLCQMRIPVEQPLPHSHSLIVRDANVDKKDPHELTVSQNDEYLAIFKGMTIMKRKTAEIENELLEKLVEKWEFECDHALTPEQKDPLRAQAKTHATKINMNRVVLCFEVYALINGQLRRLCEPVFSTPINDKRCTACGKLEICRISTMAGCVTGGEDLFMFVKKVDKKSIKVKFYEHDKNGKVIWEDDGKFTEADVHYQYAIALKTPPYRKPNITENVSVFIQLYRTTDSATSEPFEFRYKPCDDMVGNRKRPRIFQTTCNSDTPGVIEQDNQYRSQSNDHIQQRNDVNNDIENAPKLKEKFKDKDYLKQCGDSFFDKRNQELMSDQYTDCLYNTWLCEMSAAEAVQKKFQQSPTLSSYINWLSLGSIFICFIIFCCLFYIFRFF